MYKASLGKSVKISSIIGTVLLLSIVLVFLVVFIFKLIKDNFEKEDIMLPIFVLVILAILNYSYGERILGYDVTTEGVKIVKGNNTELIRKDRIIEVKLIDKSDLKFAIRTFGIGGVFSYSGTFSNKKLGSMTWYLTRKDSLVMLVTKMDKIVLSPDNCQEFYNKVKKMI